MNVFICLVFIKTIFAFFDMAVDPVFGAEGEV